MAERLNDEFREAIDAAFVKEFPGVKVETFFDIIGTMRLVTVREDRRAFNAKQRAWIAAYSLGYTTAMEKVSKEDRKR